MPSWRSATRTGTASRTTTEGAPPFPSQRGLQLVPGEDGWFGGRARNAGGIKDHPHSPLPEQAEVALERRVPGQRGVRPRHRDDRQAGAEALVQQPERQRVADAQRQPVDRAERGRGHDERVGRRQHVRIIRLLVVRPDRMTGQPGQAARVEELGPVRSGDHADVPALLLGEADEGVKLRRRGPAARHDVKNWLDVRRHQRTIPVPSSEAAKKCRSRCFSAVVQRQSKSPARLGAHRAPGVCKHSGLAESASPRAADNQLNEISAEITITPWIIESAGCVLIMVPKMASDFASSHFGRDGPFHLWFG